MAESDAIIPNDPENAEVAVGAVAEAPDDELADGANWFSEERIDIIRETRKLPETGSARFIAREKEFVAGWSDIDTVASSNIPMLRCMAIAHFYQSEFSKARNLLIKIVELTEKQQTKIRDIDVLLMRAECDLALDNDDGNASVKRFIEIGSSSNITIRDMLAWDVQLVKNKRFLGSFLILYLGFRKYKITRHPTDEDGHFIRWMIKTIVHRITKINVSIWLHEKIAFIQVLNKLLEKHRHVRQENSVVDAYVQALVHNCISWCYLTSGCIRKGLDSAREGLTILPERVEPDKVERHLRYNLLVNRAFASYPLADNEEKWKEFRDSRKDANKVYKAASRDRDNKDDSDELHENKALNTPWVLDAAKIYYG